MAVKLRMLERIVVSAVKLRLVAIQFGQRFANTRDIQIPSTKRRQWKKKKLPKLGGAIGSTSTSSNPWRTGV